MIKTGNWKLKIEKINCPGCFMIPEKTVEGDLKIPLSITDL